MADYADTLAARDELRRRSSEWGVLSDVRVTGRMGHWSLVAVWAELHKEPRWTIGPEELERSKWPPVRHVLLTAMDEPPPPSEDQLARRASLAEVADDFGF